MLCDLSLGLCLLKTSCNKEITLLIFLDICLFLAVLGLCCCKLSLVMERRGYSLIVVPGFLLAVASLAAEHWL